MVFVKNTFLRKNPADRALFSEKWPKYRLFWVFFRDFRVFLTIFSKFSATGAVEICTFAIKKSLGGFLLEKVKKVHVFSRFSCFLQFGGLSGVVKSAKSQKNDDFYSKKSAGFWLPPCLRWAA